MTPDLVYFILDPVVKSVKIGRTGGCPFLRMAGIQTGNPTELRFLGAIHEDKVHTEAYFHNLFAAHHIRGEWFRYSAELKREIARFGIGAPRKRDIPPNDPPVLWQQPKKRAPVKKSVGKTFKGKVAHRETATISVFHNDCWFLTLEKGNVKLVGKPHWSHTSRLVEASTAAVQHYLGRPKPKDLTLIIQTDNPTAASILYHAVTKGYLKEWANQGWVTKGGSSVSRELWGPLHEAIELIGIDVIVRRKSEPIYLEGEEGGWKNTGDTSATSSATSGSFSSPA